MKNTVYEIELLHLPFLVILSDCLLMTLIAATVDSSSDITMLDPCDFSLTALKTVAKDPDPNRSCRMYSPTCLEGIPAKR